MSENKNIDIMNIPAEKFEFANSEGKLHDKELVTKPISYFRDAFNRFKKNKGSIVAAIIILILVAYAIFVPMLSPYSVSYKDAYYAYNLPKVQVFSNLGWDFLDGCEDVTINEANFAYYYLMGEETGNYALKRQEYELKTTYISDGKDSQGNIKYKEVNTYKVRLDSYAKVGCVFINLSTEEYENLQKYQDDNNLQIIYPYINKKIFDEKKEPQYLNDANYWYNPKTLTFDDAGLPIFEVNYLAYWEDKNGQSDDYYTSKMRVEGEDNFLYSYASKKQNSFNVRVNYYEYYKYYHSEVLKDNIKEPSFIFGTTAAGKDIFTCLASGARFSFIFAICVAAVNLVVGAIYGAIEGYYGGKVDIIMERIVEILSSVPFMIVITLLKYHNPGKSTVLILFISFFLTGWIGMAGRTRMQFYRFKNQEYVLAARTLGAKDLRVMFKHIFPNSLGTLITGSVLIIPGMIFSETSLTYLGIINLESGNRTSVGTMLANAKSYLSTYPHMILFPALFISLLMLSFNLFGNGLRDAFNPSLRGSED